MTNILLLEKIHSIAKTHYEAHGFQVTEHGPSETGAPLVGLLKGQDIVGLRSKTQLTGEVLQESPHLSAVGAYCIGTNQIDLQTACKLGVAVFNAPFSNTRSVAEMVLAEIICLARGLFAKSQKMHAGIWEKSAAGSNEIRGKVLGIVGYGHIGSQVGILAESLGMRVIFYDAIKKLPLGNAEEMMTLGDVLSRSDFVTLHVPLDKTTEWMIGEKQFSMMKKGAAFINASRGHVVRLEALKNALLTGHISGAAIDVFPEEPKENNSTFAHELQNIENVILTPHIAGSTIEAQESIGVEVTESLIRFMKTGHSVGAVNFPQLYLSELQSGYRILNVHKNVAGVLGEVNKIFSHHNINILSQQLKTNEQIGYLAVDVEGAVDPKVVDAIAHLPTSIKTRFLASEELGSKFI
ncbi:MAG: phosphoglycerate dehydrogenase [Bdellovibrionaceae bacterium]|nr:phosphoglycerate dehydrogenase [Pseudobdellovibrionaceae bacterium]